MQSLPALALLGLVVASPLPIRAGEKETTPPVMVMRVRSLENVFENVKLFARLAGKEELGRQLEGIIKAKTGPKGLEGIDQKRPFGFYTKVGNDLSDVAGVLMIPIADEKAFLSLLENVNFPAKRTTDGGYTIEPNSPLPVQLDFRFAHNYAYFTAINLEAISKANLVSPATVFPAGNKACVSMTIRLDLIPDVAKQIALQQVDDFLAREKEKKPPQETEKQRELREKVLDTVAARMGAVIREGHALNAHVDIDQATKQLKAEVSLTAKPNSRLATGLEDLGKSTSLFGALVSGENALSVLLHVAIVPKEFRSAFVGAVEDGIKQGLAKEKDEVKREHARRFLKSLEPTLMAGEMDGTVVLRGPSPDKTYTLIGGFKLKDGLEVEKAMRGALKDLPPTERAKVKLDAETIGDVKVHRIDAQGKYDAKAREAFGDNPIFVAFRPDAVIAVVGHDGLAAVKEALMAQPKVTSPARVQFDVARLVGAFSKTDAQTDPFRKVFTAAGNSGAVRIAVEGGDALRLSFAADLSVLEFMGYFVLAKARVEPTAAPSPE